jgi:hypothetical protein
MELARVKGSRVDCLAGPTRLRALGRSGHGWRETVHPPSALGGRFGRGTRSARVRVGRRAFRNGGCPCLRSARGPCGMGWSSVSRSAPFNFLLVTLALFVAGGPLLAPYR